MVLCFFFFKQKTAYEMRISDWSSDVCSSDLPTLTQVPPMMPWPMRATWAPASAAVMAAENPAEPAPITARSYRFPEGLSVHSVVVMTSAPRLFPGADGDTGHRP